MRVYCSETLLLSVRVTDKIRRTSIRQYPFGVVFNVPVAIYSDWLAVWFNGNALVSINVVTLRWPRLVPGRVTAFRWINYLGM